MVLKIGLDLHGVIDRYPIFFKMLMKNLPAHDFEIHILTGINSDEAIKQLGAFGITRGDFRRLFSIEDFVKTRGYEHWRNEDGSFQCADEIFWGAKGEYCHWNAIDIMVDNSIEFKSMMPKFTQFIFFEDIQNIEKLHEKVLGGHSDASKTEEQKDEGKAEESPEAKEQEEPQKGGDKSEIHIKDPEEPFTHQKTRDLQ